MTTESLSAADREALERAIQLARAANREEREHIDNVMTREGWLGAGEAAVFFCQTRALRLRPWQPLFGAAVWRRWRACEC